MCLFCREFFKRHFASVIQQLIKDGQNEFSIIDTQVLAVSSDSARNVIRAANDFITDLSRIENEDEAAAAQVEDEEEEIDLSDT